ncbi:MAG: DUF58 domain-containing protein [Cyclobacteriaceae bacterium]
MIRLIKSLFISHRFFQVIIGLVLLFILSFVLQGLIWIPKILFFSLIAACIVDLVLLYRVKKGLLGARFTPDKLSNGDENEIRIYLENLYVFSTRLRIFDEIPHQFQKRDLQFEAVLKAGEKKTIPYFLRPVKRGEYSFGAVNVLVATPLGLLSRKFSFSQDKMVPVYPSYIQMRKYELLAISNRLMETGIKKIRRIGHNQEFELIKEYVSGDDFRTVNWKATSRRSKLMVNHYQDERSQQVYSLIDKGRAMQMPFNGLSLLDYAINASLVISNIAIKKSDKAGLITFQETVNTIVPAARLNGQMRNIQEALYKQKTAFVETDFSALHATIRHKLSQRSLLLLFTNFETVFALQRQLPYFTSLARQHLLVVIFFENTELHQLLNKKTDDLKEIYQKAIAERLHLEKKLIIKELQKHGIQALLTKPENLTVNTINKYLELKARNLI